MTNKPKQIGTAAETAVVKAFQRLGFPEAARIAQHGVLDEGDIVVTRGVICEVKGGEAARSASDNQFAWWLEETERERRNANAYLGILVVQRRGIGAQNAHRWWAQLTGEGTLTKALGLEVDARFVLQSVCAWLPWQRPW